MPVIDIQRAKLHVQEFNSGAQETIILIHGMFSNLAVYYFNIAPVLAMNFRVILYDMKGHGMSEKVKHGYDLSSMTDDLSELMASLNIMKAHLVGYSYGGLVALKMAMRFPEKINKLAVIEGPDPNEQETLSIIDTYSREFLEHYVENFADTTKMQMGRRQMEKNHRMYEFLFNETTIRSDMESEKDFFQQVPMGQIGHETLLIYGDQSDCVPSGETLASKIEKSNLVLVPGDHNVPIQQPETIGSELLLFFNDYLDMDFYKSNFLLLN